MKKIFLILIFCFFSCAANAANSFLVTTDFNGKNFDLAQQKDKIVIVNLWAKWCIDCRREMPVLDELYKKYHAKGLEIIAISVDPKNQTDEVKKIAKRFSYPNSMLSDVKKSDFESPRSLPTNYIMLNGKVIKVLDDSKLLMRDFEDVILPLFKMNLVH